LLQGRGLVSVGLPIARAMDRRRQNRASAKDRRARSRAPKLLLRPFFFSNKFPTPRLQWNTESWEKRAMDRWKPRSGPGAGFFQTQSPILLRRSRSRSTTRTTPWIFRVSNLEKNKATVASGAQYNRRTVGFQRVSTPVSKAPRPSHVCYDRPESSAGRHRSGDKRWAVLRWGPAPREGETRRSRARLDSGCLLHPTASTFVVPEIANALGLCPMEAQPAAKFSATVISVIFSGEGATAEERVAISQAETRINPGISSPSVQGGPLQQSWGPGIKCSLDGYLESPGQRARIERRRSSPFADPRS